jgi:hypothetical protein
VQASSYTNFSMRDTSIRLVKMHSNTRSGDPLEAIGWMTFSRCTQ